MPQVFLKAQNSSKKAAKNCEFKEICFRIFCLNKKGEIKYENNLFSYK